ncbi:synaptopodin 2-like protein [Siniperca chuatsi]|uniref:synaptopodin 2-like protein n=1 Tax=Siniperca chuatsi TaxID=119488 RepID=UPI001CE1CA2E|nr:synaptopodin 2-like protein [Siniperca chuatsi]XP_044062266.1 synaptopodin 2-like protein [Siniperca chuatsi]
MEMEKGHMSIRREVSWSPGRLRKPLQATQNTPGTECNAPWEKTGFNKEQMSRKTNLTRSASLSEKELKEARVRSQIIAAQLTIPSNSSSRGVQLFNRRKQRVNAFTLESCGEGSREDRAENVKIDPSSNKLTWAERSSEEKDRDLNFKNSSTKPLLSPPGRVHSVGDIMEDSGKDFHKEEDMEDSVIQERHFLPVKEEQEEEEEARDEIHEELEDKVKDEIPPGSNNTDPVLMGHTEGQAEINGGHTGPVPLGKLLNGCHSTSGPERVSVPTSKQTSTIINRTARPFFSPLTVQSPEAVNPVMDIPRPPTYATPPLPAFTAPQPVAFSAPPPPPSYPTPPLPAFTNQPMQTYYSSPPPMSPIMSPSSPPPSQFPVSSVSQFSPMPHYGPPTAPKPSTFVPQPAGERKPITAIKTGILEEGAARRSSRKSMFTFKEKPVVAPNPELLSLVQGVDERKKHGQRSVPELAPEEELLALGAEASNFLAKEEDRAEEARAPEWASCLKSSRTRPRAEHRPEQSLTNVSGKGAELFAKRQSRMEKYVVEKQNSGQIRSPSPTMSLPPSWVYPSNMPGRVKAIAKNSDMSAQLSQNLNAQQAVKQKPRQKAPAPEPIPEPPPLENGCSKIEMDLSRHQPYQLNSSLFIFNPAKDPISTLPRGAPQSKNLMSTQSFSRQTSLPYNPPSHFSSQCMSPQLPLSPTRGGAEYAPNPTSGQPRISSPMSAFSPERVSSPRSGVQAPRPTFSAKKAGIAPQTPKDSSPVETPSETPTPTRTPSLNRRISSPEGPATGTCTPSLQNNRPSTNISSRSVTSPVSSPRGTRCQSPMASQNIRFSTATSRPSQTSTATSPRSTPWGSRCQSPMVSQNTQSSSSSSIPAFRPSQTSTTTSPLSPPWGSRCQSPMVSQHTQSSTVTFLSTSRPSQTSTATSPCSPPWGSRCQSPMVSQNTQSSTFSSVPTSRPSQTSTTTSPWGSRCQSPMVSQNTSTVISISTSRPTQTYTTTSPVPPPLGSRSQSPALSQTSLSFPATKPLYTSSATSPLPPPKDSRCMSPIVNNLDSKANHRLLAKNIINAAKRKNSPSPGALSGHSLPISPLGNSHHGYECHKPPISPFQSRALGAQSPTFTSPPPTPTQRICSPVRLYNTRSLTDSDASVESEDSGLRSPGLHSYNTCPRGWGGSLRVKRSTVSTDL